MFYVLLDQTLFVIKLIYLKKKKKMTKMIEDHGL